MTTKKRSKRPSPRTDSKREVAAIGRAEKELKKMATAGKRAADSLRTAKKYNKSERRGMNKR